MCPKIRREDGAESTSGSTMPVRWDSGRVSTLECSEVEHRAPPSVLTCIICQGLDRGDRTFNDDATCDGDFSGGCPL